MVETSVLRARPRRRAHGGLALVLVLGAGAATGFTPQPPAAVASPAVTAVATPEVLTAARAQVRKCDARRVGGTSTDGFAVTATTTGLVRVRLQPIGSTGARTGDWDAAAFGPDGQLVASSAGPRSHEVADGFVTAGDRLWVQGCRYAGRTDRVRVSVDFFATPPPSEEPAQLVSVAVRNQADLARLQPLGLDRAESGRANSVDVVLHGAADAGRLHTAGFGWTVKIADLRAHEEQVQRSERAYAATTARSPLPSGRTGYRRLADYEYEMKELARRHPGLVRLDVLRRQTVEGRDISAIEITRQARNTDDGKLVFLNLGLLHAREWPSGELPMEFGYDLINGYGHDRRITRLLQSARAIILPVANPDGFSVSRQAAPRGDFSRFDYEYARKNCDPADAPAAALRTGPCPASAAGTDRGTDLNRNFGAFWGGPGSGANWAADDYRGSAPFSEPETEAIRELAAGRQITNVIGNHTPGDEVLRPPGLSSTGQPVDAPLLARLGRAFTAHNRYRDYLIYQNYDATGSSDDWFYWVTGALSLTFEIGDEGFHPEFAHAVVAEYLGRAPAVGAGSGGNREAYFAMLESTANSTDHATLTGRAPKGWTLRLRKDVITPTSSVLADDRTADAPLPVSDHFDSTLRAPGGSFSWAVNPSTRPYVAGRYGRTPTAPPQSTVTLVNPPGRPGINENGDVFNGPRETVPFTVAGRPTVDNGTATVKLNWSKPDTSWFLFVFDDQDNLVGETYPFGETSTEITLYDPAPGTYHAVIENFQQADQSYDDWSGSVSFASPKPAVAGKQEAWTLSCRRPDGRVVGSRAVIIERGQRLDVGSVCRPSH